jgi:hypothetical protein
MTIKQAENIWVTNNLNRNNYGTNKFNFSNGSDPVGAFLWNYKRVFYGIHSNPDSEFRDFFHKLHDSFRF